MWTKFWPWDRPFWGPEIWAPSQYPKRRLFVRSRKVSKPRDWYFKLSHRFEIWQAHRQHCCRSACQISERSGNSKYKSRGFETLRDLTERRLFRYWHRALIPVEEPTMEHTSYAHWQIIGRMPSVVRRIAVWCPACKSISSTLVLCAYLIQDFKYRCDTYQGKSTKTAPYIIKKESPGLNWPWKWLFRYFESNTCAAKVRQSGHKIDWYENRHNFSILLVSFQ